MSKKKYYITTALPYASTLPHIGNVYEAIITDAIARFKRLDGFDVWFHTGTDEHGQKIESKAAQNELEPKQYVDLISNDIKAIFKMVNISYDYFIRTTDEYHVEQVQKIFKKLYDQKDIYLGKYEGWYSVSEEAYITESEIVDGKCPNGDTPIWMEEEVYFFDLKKYQKRLVDHINNNPDFIQPESRKNEMLNNFLKEPLLDLSVSRTSFEWGIPVSFAPGHIVYVWIDALSNYITGLGYDVDGNNGKLFNEFWPADVHIIGKDILRFHTIYWPIILMALDLPLPKKIFAHPWILFNKEKMSKSTGNVMYTKDLVDLFGTDVVRYYCIHEIPYAQDGNMTYQLIIERNNSDLANTIGNLVNRTIGMANKYKEGYIRNPKIKEPFDLDLKEKCLETLPKIRSLIEDLRVGDALEEVVQLARFANKYIDVSEPWLLFKDENKKDELDHVLYNLVETIRFIASLLQPFLPETAKKIASQIITEDLSFDSLREFGRYKDQKIGKAEVLFERYDVDKKLEEIEKKKQ
ncbi:methionine--tRNA ligase [Acholeplasma sp. OttesenSCG-928-E16]|nr:methionine--tRNA ligase [Acholeplasma sp. OttesenSCG-928-E16]